jgi:hypothetical protein
MNKVTLRKVASQTNCPVRCGDVLGVKKVPGTLGTSVSPSELSSPRAHAMGQSCIPDPAGGLQPVKGSPVLLAMVPLWSEPWVPLLLQPFQDSQGPLETRCSAERASGGKSARSGSPEWPHSTYLTLWASVFFCVKCGI